MIKILNFIQDIKKSYSTNEMPFLNKQVKRVSQQKPYKNITLLHNVPFTKETILKLEPLYVGGANLTITSPSFMEVDNHLLSCFIQAGGHWVELNQLNQSVFDIHMDCAAELITKVRPRIGAVEITGTGSNKYGSTELNYPIISVDKSIIKDLEGTLGTGEAFLRAFEILTKEDLTNKKIMIFGYGKVGKGIAHYLQQKTNNIIIVDKCALVVDKARQSGYVSYGLDEKSKIEALASEMFAVVTATGYKNAISDYFDSRSFKGRYLCNMGGEDEFGYAFNDTDVMCNKKPINFFIDKPTLMRYLDPVFYAHNMGVDLLNYHQLGSGLHPYPEFLSIEVVHEWINLFNEDINI